MSKRYDEWKFYIGSEAWAKRRRQHLNTPGCDKCWNCGEADGPKNVHHTTYERLGNEAKDDLITLCRPCHEILHTLQKSGTPLEQCHLVLKQYNVNAETVTLGSSRPVGAEWLIAKIEQFKMDLRAAGPTLNERSKADARDIYKRLEKLQRIC